MEFVKDWIILQITREVGRELLSHTGGEMNEEYVEGDISEELYEDEEYVEENRGEIDGYDDDIIIEDEVEDFDSREHTRPVRQGSRRPCVFARLGESREVNEEEMSLENSRRLRRVENMVKVEWYKEDWIEM